MGALHNFLRNNFRPGEWLGQYCTPKQHNRIANILQDMQGVNCRIYKPTNKEGRGWRVIVDGTSDVGGPGDAIPAPPWNTHPVDQFRVFAVPAQNKFYVRGGLKGGLPAANYTALPDAIDWRDDSDSDTFADGYPGELSYAVAIADGETKTVWAGNAEEDVAWQLFTLGAGATSADADAWMDSAFGAYAWSVAHVATVTRNDSASPKITIEQYDDAWEVYAPVTRDHVAVLGGVWQDETDTKTTIYIPENGDITWAAGGDNSHDRTTSNAFDCSEGGKAIWAKLDLSSVTASLKLMCLAPGVEPTYATNVFWQKIATVTAVGEPDPEADPPEDPDDFDPAQVKLDIKQHHSGSIERHPIIRGVLDAYSVDNALGSSTAVPPTTGDWLPVKIGGGTVRYIDSETYVAGASGDGNTVVFDDDHDHRVFLVVLTGQFKIAASGSAGAGAPKYSIQEVALCTSDGATPPVIKGNLIHSLCSRKWEFLQCPAFTSADDPPVTVPAVLEGYGPFAIATMIVPKDDLKDNTLSVWARGRGVISAELVIIEQPDARWTVT